MAQFLAAAMFLPHLGLALKNNPKYSPRVITIASTAEYIKSSNKGRFADACSKAASLYLTSMLATALKDAKIIVNCIAPDLFPIGANTKGNNNGERPD